MTEFKQDFDFQELSNVFGILTKVEHEERKSQLEQISGQIQEIKKAIACFLFLDSLQEYLSDINNNKIKCGCDRCIDVVGGNYPHTEDNQNVDGTWGPSWGPAHATETKNCLLYKYFKNECEKFKCPIPDDEIDHPINYPRSANISACLGRNHKGSGPWNEKQLPRRWRYRVKQLPFREQVRTVYRMLFYLHTVGESSIKSEPEVIDTFDNEFKYWFKVKQVSLL